MGMTGYYFRTEEEIIRKLQNSELDLEDLIYDKSLEDHLLDIDKAWHAIHFTLTGLPFGADDGDILGLLVLSGNMLTGQDDPLSAMVIEASDVTLLADALNNISGPAFRDSFSVSEMLHNNIYPVTEGEDEDAFFEYVWSYFTLLKDFITVAADSGQAVIFYIS